MASLHNQSAPQTRRSSDRVDLRAALGDPRWAGRPPCDLRDQPRTSFPSRTLNCCPAAGRPDIAQARKKATSSIGSSGDQPCLPWVALDVRLAGDRNVTDVYPDALRWVLRGCAIGVRGPSAYPHLVITDAPPGVGELDRDAVSPRMRELLRPRGTYAFDG